MYHFNLNSTLFICEQKLAYCYGRFGYKLADIVGELTLTQPEGSLVLTGHMESTRVCLYDALPAHRFIIKGSGTELIIEEGENESKEALITLPNYDNEVDADVDVEGGEILLSTPECRIVRLGSEGILKVTLNFGAYGISFCDTFSLKSRNALEWNRIVWQLRSPIV